jgi:hypothetical protein
MGEHNYLLHYVALVGGGCLLHDGLHQVLMRIQLTIDGFKLLLYMLEPQK